MIARDLISENIPGIQLSETGAFALNVMDELKVSHLPVLKELVYVGLISETDIYSLNNTEKPISVHESSLKRLYVSKEQHVFDVIKMMASNNLTVLPVLDEKDEYLGSVSRMDVINSIAKMSAIENPGGIIVLEMSVNDYSLSEIAQIVESNDAKILNLCIATGIDSTKLEVTVKTNKINIEPILQTFMRYNYTIKATFAEKTNYEDMKERLDEFFHFLNI